MRLLYKIIENTVAREFFAVLIQTLKRYPTSFCKMGEFLSYQAKKISSTKLLKNLLLTKHFMSVSTPLIENFIFYAVYDSLEFFSPGF